MPQTGSFTALGPICWRVINYTALCLARRLMVRSCCAAPVSVCPLPIPTPDLPLLTPRRAKEIKTKLGTLLQKPDSAIDFIIPYPEKPEKPAKAQK